jgi:TRAP transporter TAXI family solute receptor
MKTLKIAVYAGLFSLAVVGGIHLLTSLSPKTDWVISGGEEHGKYDEVARSLGEAMSKSQNWKARVDNSSGSRQNLNRLGNGEADLCLVQNDVEGNEKVRLVATLYEETLHLIVRKEVTSVAQLSKGILSIGPAGGGTEGLSLATLRQVGLREDEVTLRRESLESGLTALREGQADGVCIVTGIGNATIGEFLADGKFALLDLDKDLYESIKYSYPFVQPSVIPAGAYPTEPGEGQPAESLPTIGTKVLLACRNDLAVQDIFELTRFLHENQAALVRSQPLLVQMGYPQDSHHLQFPIHEGARLHYDRDEPNFIQKWAETIALVLSILAIAWGVGTTIRQIYLMRLKESLDEFFAKVEAITSELVEGASSGRTVEIAKELHDIRRETTKKLIAEELGANESFVIFQRQLHTAQQMVNEALRKSEGRPVPESEVDSEGIA